MNTALLWVTTAVLGMAAATATAILGVGAAVIGLVLVVPLILRGDRLVVLSGVLIGFGGLWLAVLQGQVASGGVLDAAQTWILVGAVPFATGLAALGIRAARHRRSLT